jgi:hypothetical protein
MAAALVPGQAKFASTLSRETGLNPRVIGSWLLAEQSGSAAKYYEDKSYNDWLNIANTDSGPASGAHSSVWKNPETAAKATAEWLKGTGQIAKEYGAPAAGIRGILSTSGKGPQEQINAIAKSGWASSGYNGGNTLRELFNQIGPGEIPVEARPPKGAESASVPGVSVTPPTTAFDKAAYQEASTASTIGKLYSAAERQNNPLFTTGALTTKEPSRAEFTTSVPGKVTAAATPAAPSTSGSTPKLPGINGKTADAHGGDGFTAASGTNYTYGKTPEISDRLNDLGKALGVKLTGVSGYRTPEHSVAVGGFADDPHTKGLASDTEGTQSIPKSVLNKYGLERPFPGAKEADHIQLLHSVNANGGY